MPFYRYAHNNASDKPDDCGNQPVAEALRKDLRAECDMGNPDCPQTGCKRQNRIKRQLKNILEIIPL